MSMPTTTRHAAARVVILASRVAVAVFLVMAVVQLAITVGILPVTIVCGASQHGRTWQTNVASIVAAMILLGMAWIIHERAEATTTVTMPSTSLRVASWVVVLYMILNTLGNSLSTSAVERYVFGAMTEILAICSVIVASSSSTVSEEQGYVNYQKDRSTYQSIP